MSQQNPHTTYLTGRFQFQFLSSTFPVSTLYCTLLESKIRCLLGRWTERSARGRETLFLLWGHSSTHFTTSYYPKATLKPKAISYLKHSFLCATRLVYSLKSSTSSCDLMCWASNKVLRFLASPTSLWSVLLSRAIIETQYHVSE